MLPRNLLIIFVAAILSWMCYQKAEFNRHASSISHVMATIEQKYVDKVDRQRLYEGALDGMIRSLDDPYSAYISEEEYTKFEEGLEQEFGGVGIIVEQHPKTKRLMVMNPLVDTPAYKAGLKSGDTILEIEGKPTNELSMTDAVKLMRGPPQTPVKLLILHAGETAPKLYEILRAKIPVESVLGDVRGENGRWSYTLESHPRLAYLRIVTFGEHTVDELKRAIGAVDGKVDGIILDLRDNAGGLLSAAVKTCDMFLADGEIVSTRGRAGAILKESRRYKAEADLAVPLNLPLVILVNHFSASASEIVAACLQDHGRATVIGERTWGKGTVQTVVQLAHNPNSAIKLTTASYWRPSAKNIHRLKDAKPEDDWGVRPNTGFEVKISESDSRKLMRYRRYRDVHRGAKPEPDEKPAPDTKPEPSTKPESDTKSEPKPSEEPKPSDTKESKSDSEPSDPKAPEGETPETETAVPEPIEDVQLKRAIELLTTGK